jgi:hypothetical protein
MATLKDVKARIATVLQTVPGIGRVYARMRPVNLQSVEISDFVADGVLNCCFVQRGSADFEGKGGDTPPLVSQWDVISVHAFYAVQDSSSSEDIFDLLVDQMLWAILTDSVYPKFLAQTVKRSRVPKLKTVDFRRFGPSAVLCHHAEITIQVMTQTSNS